MANGWTLERRQRQAEKIRIWKPWEKSTGARTSEGKRKISKNALKGGAYSIEMKTLRRLLNELTKEHRYLQDRGQKLAKEECIGIGFITDKKGGKS